LHNLQNGAKPALPIAMKVITPDCCRGSLWHDDEYGIGLGSAKVGRCRNVEAQAEHGNGFMIQLVIVCDEALSHSPDL